MNASLQSALVTGGSGFVGRHLIEALLARGAGVIALCRPSSELPPNWGGAVKRIDCADWTQTGISAALGTSRFDCLFHLAAYGVVPTDRDPVQMNSINAQLPAELVGLCRRMGAAMVMTGSSAEYLRSDGPNPLTEEAPLEAEKSYGASKAQGALLACRAADLASVPLRVLRLFNVYGPGEAAYRLLPSLVSGFAAGRRVSLSAGQQVRDFVYVGDVVEALLVAADHAQGEVKPASRIWNVATEEGHSVREFAEMAARLFGKGRQLLGFGDIPMRPDEIGWLVGSARRIREESGWMPRHDLSSGIAVSLAGMTGQGIQTRVAQ